MAAHLLPFLSFPFPSLPLSFFLFFLSCFLFNLLIDFREKQRNIDFLSHPFIHSLVDFCMFPGWGLKQLSCQARAFSFSSRGSRPGRMTVWLCQITVLWLCVVFAFL